METKRFLVTTIDGCIESVKAVSDDVAPVVHGKWINGRCNKCGEHAPFWAMASTYYTSNFCPNCGVKMDGGKNT